MSDPQLPAQTKSLPELVREEAPKAAIKWVVGSLLTVSATAVATWAASLPALGTAVAVAAALLGFGVSAWIRRTEVAGLKRLLTGRWSASASLHFRVTDCRGEPDGRLLITLTCANGSSATWHVKSGRLDHVRLGGIALQSPLETRGIIPGQLAIPPFSEVRLVFDGPLVSVPDEGRWTAVFLGEDVFTSHVHRPGGHLVVKSDSGDEESVAVPPMRGFVATSQLQTH